MKTLNGMDAATSRCVASHLVVLTDQLSEALASVAGDGADERVTEALKTLWKLRWELGLIGGCVTDDLEPTTAEAAQ